MTYSIFFATHFPNQQAILAKPRHKAQKHATVGFHTIAPPRTGTSSDFTYLLQYAFLLQIGWQNLDHKIELECQKLIKILHFYLWFRIQFFDHRTPLTMKLFLPVVSTPRSFFGILWSFLRPMLPVL